MSPCSTCHPRVNYTCHTSTCHPRIEGNIYIYIYEIPIPMRCKNREKNIRQKNKNNHTQDIIYVVQQFAYIHENCRNFTILKKKYRVR